MNIEQLANRDYTLILDKSGSMNETDCPGGKSRWAYMQESTVAVANECAKHDPDGITVIPFASTFKTYENTTPNTVGKIFQENSPMGGTVLAPVLRSVFENYKKNKAANKAKPNGELLLVVTDGCPVDEKEVAGEIVAFTKTLDSGDAEFGISFIQVGKDSGAAAFLKKLDDDLTAQGAKFDIVDTKTMDELEAVGLTEALIAALND